MNETLQRTFVRDEAYCLLRDWIVSGKLGPGQKLRDKELAEQLGVSRTPIREALLRLEDEGLVQTKPNSSTIVSPIDLKDAWNLYSLVWTLESLALSQAFDFLEEEHILVMELANERMLHGLKTDQTELAIDADNTFHAAYNNLAHNQELSQMLLSIKQKINRMKQHYFHEVKDKLLSYQEHILIIQALKDRNLKKALEAVESNWRAACRRILTQGEPS